MKRINILLASLLAVFLLSGCTLSMDDFIDSDPDASLGKGDPVYIENEMGTINYQLNDNVTVITTKALEHLTAVEGDSVFYFDGDLPDRYIPRVGAYVSSNPSEQLPLGLAHRVVACDRRDGRVCMQLAPATVKEIFKFRKIKLSFDYVVPGEIARKPDSTAGPGTRAGDVPLGRHLNDSVFVDMRYIRKEAGGPLATRAAAVVNSDTVITQKYGASLNILSTIASLSLTTENVVKKRMEYEEDTERGYRKLRTVQNGHTDYTVELKYTGNDGIALGWDIDWEDPDKDAQWLNNFTNTTDYLSEIEELKKRGKKGLAKFTKTFAPETTLSTWFPLPFVSCLSFVLEFNPSASITPALMGSFTVRVTQPETVSGFVEDGLSCTTISEKPKGSGDKELVNVSAAGSLTLQGALEVGAGIGGGAEAAGVVAGATLGLEAALELNFPFDLYDDSDNDESLYTIYEGEDNFNVTLNFDLYAKAQVYVTLLDQKRYNPSLEFFRWHIWKGIWSTAPRAKLNAPKISYSTDSAGNVSTLYKMSYKVDRFYARGANTRKITYPELRIYPGSLQKGSKDYITLKPVDPENGTPAPKSLELNKDYHFFITKAELEKELGVWPQYVIVPVLQQKKSLPSYLPMARVLKDDSRTLVGAGDPRFSDLIVGQNYGYYDEETGIYDYEVAANVTITNAYLIANWGFEIMVKTGDGKFLIDKKRLYYKPGKEVRSGRHTAYIMFSTNYGKRVWEYGMYGNQRDLTIEVRPFYRQIGYDEIKYGTKNWSTAFWLICPFGTSVQYEGEYDNLIVE